MVLVQASPGQEMTTVAVDVYLRMAQKQLMLQPLMVEPLLAHAVLIVIAAMTGRAKTEKDRVWITKIMVAVCRV